MLCNLCPRQCSAPRTDDSGSGFCGVGRMPIVSRAAAHLWEEPCISGTRGSGTVFFSGCSLGCIFCQNEPISHHLLGQTMDAPALAELFTRVEGLGVHNLNLVNPTHFAPVILEALALAKLSIPVVWNSSGYESLPMIESCKGLIDIFLPDFKFADPQTGATLANAPDYFEVALAAIRAMCLQTGAPIYNEDGLLLRGTLVRHLILPMRTNESMTILNAIAEELPESTPVSLMRQYTPMLGAMPAGLDRRLTAREYLRVREHMLSLGLPGYLQQKESADSAYTPAFMDEESILLFPDAEA